MPFPIDMLPELQQRHPNIRTFLETGTLVGSTVAQVMDCFDQIFSIELSAEHYRQCSERFKEYKKVRLFNGSSRLMLDDMLREAGDVPILFWLDAHYSAGSTALEGEGLDCPIRWELESIKRHGRKDHVILIDDMRDMMGDDDSSYPGEEELRSRLKEINPDYCLRIVSTEAGLLVAEPK